MSISPLEMHRDDLITCDILFNRPMICPLFDYDCRFLSILLGLHSMQNIVISIAKQNSHTTY